MKRIILSFVLLAGAQAHAEPMRFLAHETASAATARGDIDSSTVAAFNAYKKAHPGLRTIAFDSNGGSVVEALALGRAIREAGLDTYVGGTYKVPREGFTAANFLSMQECYSACVYAFAGGVHRFYDANGGVLGVHQFSGNDTASGEMTAQVLMTLIGVYLDEMGVSRTLLDWAAMVPPNTIQPLPRALAERFQLDNTGDREAPRSSTEHSTPGSDLERGLSQTDLYNAATGDYNRGKFDLALQGFQDFLKYYGNADLAPNAQYWIGQTYYSQQKYEDAALAFDLVLERFPENAKTRDAKLYKGMSLVALGKRSQAHWVFQEMEKQYPNTEAWTRACNEDKVIGFHCYIHRP
jgi:tol-pal system protein YbgF